jgi:signal transduction histidine kinase
MKKAGVLICMILLSWSVIAQEETYILKESDIETDLSGYLFSAKNIKFKEEKEIILHKKEFKKVNENIANFGNNDDENWIYFNLKNQLSQNQKFVLLLEQTFLEKADFYIFEKDSLINKYLLNDSILAKNKPFSQAEFTYPFALKYNTDYDIFLRIKANPNNGTSKALMTLFDEISYLESIKFSQLKFGILIGFLLLAVVTGLLLFIYSPKNIYLIYVVDILIVMCSYLSNYGYFNGTFGNHSLGSAVFYQSMLMFGGAFQILLFRHFVVLPIDNLQKYDRAILLLSLYFFLIGIVNFILPFSHLLPFISRISLSVLLILILSVTLWSFFRKENVSKIYIIALTPAFLLLLYLLLSSLKVLPLNHFVFAILFPISAYEIIILGFGLVYNFAKEKEEVELKLSEERRTVAHKLITTQEQERQRIAQDLHDDLGSTLSMLKNKLSESNETFDNQLLTEMNYADKAVLDLRIISHNLMPVLFLQKGLKLAVQEFVNLNNIKNNIHFITSGNEKKLDWEIELSIFRIAKELLNNALKHAKASNIEVQLIYFEKFLYLSVEDNGVGFLNNDPEIKGIGLKNITLRVNYLNGKMDKESSNKGTLIAIEIPYDTNPKDKNSSD